MTNIIQHYNMIFFKFVQNYDIQNPNIVRKIIHSYSVAQKCFEIACKLNLNERQRYFCYLLGLFHDLGRFEQWKLYQTYNDMQSVDHGDLSYEIIDHLDYKNLFLTQKQFNTLKIAIKYHTKPYKGKNKEIIFYNKIIKNADAFCNIITCANGMQQITTNKNGITKFFLDRFLNLKSLYGYSPNTKLDRVLCLTACVYYVDFDFLKQEIKNNNYLDLICDYFSKFLNKNDKQTYQTSVEKIKPIIFKNIK